MKTANVYFKKRVFWCATALLCLALVGAASAQVSGNTQYCEITLTGCPQEYDGDNLVVPLSVVALSTKVRACGIQDSSRSLGAAPAVMFIIDHSTSMTSNAGAAGNDANGNRFKVTKALIDSIYKTYPDAEVGMVIFANGLVFSSSRDGNLVDFTGVVDDSGGNLNRKAYLPLLQLNQPVNGGGTSPFTSAPGANNIDIYRNIFTVTGSGRGQIPNLPEVNGTDITIAFEAALEAFSKTTKSRENQYIIFLSDGLPIIYSTGVNGQQTAAAVNPSQRCNVSAAGIPGPGGQPPNPRCSMLLDFEKGTLNGKLFPTTYTVFLTNDPNPKPPSSIETMTINVQNNGYSATNKSSNAWALQSNYSALLDTMMNNIITPMLSKSSGSAKSITIASPGAKDSTGNIAEGEFNFSRRLPVDTTAITAVNMTLRYDVEIDSTITYPDGTTGTVVVRTVKDSIFEYNFTVRRTSNPPANWEASQGLKQNCKQAPTLSLQYSGTTLDTINPVKGHMDLLTILFDNKDGLFSYDSVRVQVLNADGSVSDLESFKLTKGLNDTWTYQFQRTVSETANPGDNKLQHAAADSIILIFRNPSVPLDTIRVSVPFISNSLAFYDTPGNPSGHEKLADTISVKAGSNQDLYAKLFDGNGLWDEKTMKEGTITWDGGSKALTIDKTDPTYAKFYTETAGNVYTITATYKNGPLTITKQITIKVVPGDPKYLEIVTDPKTVADSSVTKRKVTKNGATDTAYLSNNKDYTFKRDMDNTEFTAVLRDAYGNFIGFANGSQWTSTDLTALNANPVGDASKADITRQSNKSGELFIIAVKDGLADTVRIMMEGESAVAVGPNPFVPGESKVSDVFLKGGGDPNGTLANTYGPIVTGSSGNQNLYDVKGILVVATAPRPVTSNGKTVPSTSAKGGNRSDCAKATAVIYDAVGHIVFRSEPTDIIIADDGSTFGFVWDGKNKAGRKVGPGSYLMRMVTTLSNGEKFSSQRMLGVTVSGSIK